MVTVDDTQGMNISSTLTRMFIFEREHHFSLHLQGPNDDNRAVTVKAEMRLHWTWAYSIITDNN